MKKTLIAIAALAATGAFAQSSVTISGTMDVGLQSGTTQAANLDTKAQTFTSNGSSTTAVNVAGVEDLGGGLKASFFLESNPAMGGEASTMTTSATTGITAPTTGTSTFANGQRFLGLEGGFGAIKMGNPNSAILQTAGVGDSFGTAVGGNYSSRFSSTGNGAGVRVIRSANTLRYDTPNFSGFSASYEIGFQNKDAAGTNTTSPGVGILGARYAAGPLTVALAVGTVKPTGATVASDSKQSHTLLSANYKLGAATLYAGFTGYKATASGVTSDETSSMNFGAKYQVSAPLSVQVGIANRKDKTPAFAAAPRNASLMALGADYSLSKRTAAYGRYEALDTNKATGVTGDQNGKGTLLAIGVRHTF
jgi:predicted porin